MATGEPIGQVNSTRKPEVVYPGSEPQQLRRLRLERDLAIAARERLAAERIVLRCLVRSRRRR